MPRRGAAPSSSSRTRASGCRPFASWPSPQSIPADRRAALGNVDPDAADPHNLYRVHWFNGPDRASQVQTPVHMELPPALTGVQARIVVVIGALFPMIRAHKVLAAYACLAPRLVSGRFDPTRQRAVWPSTGNYCRGGVAISRILGCRGVAVLPAGMSQERFDWLEKWVTAPGEDIVRTPGTESNVKEIYDKCAELARDPANEIVNQFSEFGNYLAHWRCTGPALEKVFLSLRKKDKDLRLAGFVAASGSSGTLGAGDYLKDRARRQDCRGGGRGVPHPADERLRRAQHPGHRRQARAADPQRDEHRSGDRRQRPGDRRAQRGLQYGDGARIPCPPAGVNAEATRVPRVVWAYPPLPTSWAPSRWPSTPAQAPAT